MIDGDVDDPARAAARARLAARAAHVEGGMAAQAAAEAAVEAVAELAEDVHLDAPRAALASLDVNVDVARTPAAALANGAKRKHIISPPMKSRKHKGDDGSGVDAARAARDLCGDLGEPKEALMRRAIETIGVVAANHLAIEVGRIEGAGGQMTTDGSRRRTPGGVFWALLKASVEKEDWDYIFEEEKEAQRERCRRRRRAASLNASLAGSPTFRSPASAFGGLKTPAAGLVAAAAKLEGRARARETHHGGASQRRRGKRCLLGGRHGIRGDEGGGWIVGGARGGFGSSRRVRARRRRLRRRRRRHAGEDGGVPGGIRRVHRRHPG